MLSEIRPAKVGTVDRARPARPPGALPHATSDGEVVETPEEMCWRVAQSIAAGEARYGRSPAAVREVAAAFYDMMVDALLPAELADADERRQGQRPAVLGLLRPAGGRLDGGDLRLRQGRGHHPQVGRRHRLRVLAPAAQGRPRRLHRGPRVGPGVVPARVQRRHGGGEAGRHPPRRQHGHPARRPSGHPGVHRLQARRRDHQLQHLGRRHRRLHGRAGQAARTTTSSTRTTRR